MKIITKLMLFFFPFISFSQNYNASLITDSLKKNASVVKRYEEIDVEIKSPAKATMHEKHVYTILNENGRAWANYRTYYDKFISINYIDGILYDAQGNELKHLKKKDIADISGTSDETLISDLRFKENNFYYDNYPFTVNYEEEDDIDGILSIRHWLPLNAENVSVEESKYVITAPKDYELRYMAFNFASAPLITQTKDKKIYTWDIKNIPAISEESMAPEWLAPSWRDVVPTILFAPSDFEAEGYKGNMSTWKNYGSFIHQLCQGRDILPDEIKAKVHALTDNIKNEKEKVYTLYDFLQKNTRYISIQLGIGGWQPFDANFVATRKYGDCKALSNYMIALLKEASIKANYVEIEAGEDAEPLIQNFPFSQFNHATVCVPMDKDSIWLECTSQTQAPGFAGDFTGDRKALLIDENGGHIVSTPMYTANDNLQLRTVNASIDENGNLDANVNTDYSGLQEELPRELMVEVNKEDRDKYLNKEFNLATYQVDKSFYTEVKESIPKVNEVLHLTSSSYANVSGKRLFIAPNLFNKNSGKLTADSVRKYDIVYKRTYKDVDSIHIKIPSGYTVEAMPQNINLNEKFGSYTISFKVDGDNIICVRKQVSNRFHLPASEYKNYVQFNNTIYKADRSKMVLVKKDS